ncbi:serine hydrolase domain-containing protein [Maricaulis maris]|uniref:CubicO group peptidase (Beta-lactamase class C family) n=1 Tax=Maricaulis maris TaxID=74318 RepID=A0A495DCM9_9PROT|nr:serine hydrolase domain-containing protein [Maricaulis maris]RKR00077.1 CubicO group peptidase (beta-lactamase class C family) [Maricaulis maris]
MKALSFLRRGSPRLIRSVGMTLGLALAINAAAPAQTAPLSIDPVVDRGATGDRLSDAFDALEAAGFTGIVGLSHEGETVFLRGAGEADPQTGRRYGPDTQVDTGSITKSFTGMLAAQLISDGTLSADLRLADVFDDVPSDKADITLHQMLTHAAGFPGAVGDDLADEDFDTFLANAFAAPLQFEPGTGYHYSNVGFSLAAAIMEHATGQSYEALLRDRLARVGIHSTGYQTAFDHERSVHLDDGRDVADASWGGHPPNWNLIGNGGLVSTAPDMLAWRQAWSAGDLISPQARDLGQTPFQDEGGGASHYGYGLVVEDDPALGRIYWHNGGNPHFNAHWRELADHGLILFVGTDQHRLNADRVVDVLTAAWFGQPYEVTAAPTASDAPIELPDTPTGQLVADFMAALGGDAAAHQAFIEARFTADMIAFAEMDRHLAMFAQLAADFGGQPVLGFEAGEQHVRFTVLAPSMGEAVAIQFDTTGSETRRIAGLQIG